MPETSPQEQKKTDYLHTLLQLGQTMNSSLDLSQVLHVAIEQVVDFVRAERGFLLLVEQGTNRVWGKATRNIDPVALEMTLSGRDKSNPASISRTIVEKAIRERKSILSTNAMEDPRFAERTSVQLSNVRSVLCVPLLTKNGPLGIIYLDNRIKTAVFDEHDNEMLEAFANQAAVAIENARLYDNLRKSLEERLQLQQELHANETQRLALEEANRLKSDFISFVSHELRNPLTTIRGYVQTLAQDTDDTLDRTVRGEFYETIEAEADRMLSMINEMLDSSRLEANRPLTLCVRSLDVRALLQKIARSQRFYKFWTPAHRMEVEIAPDLPEIEADEDKIHQVMTNLLSNAIKYAPDGGAIRLTAYPLADKIEIAVTDEGVGMTAEQQKKLFGQYERIEREDIKQISGTGLGLYLTRHLVELHKGTIRVESEAGKGSTFFVTLPLHQPQEEAVG